MKYNFVSEGARLHTCRSAHLGGEADAGPGSSLSPAGAPEGCSSSQFCRLSAYCWPGVGWGQMKETKVVSEQDALLEFANKYLAGGCLGQWRMPDKVAFVAARGAGSHLWDIDGREYIDYVMGSGPLIIGHAAPSVVEAVQRQAALGSHFYALNEGAIELAKLLVEAVPCAELVRFTSTGSEATLQALRMARAFTGRDKILKFEGGFHGFHDYSLQSMAPAVLSQYPQGIPDSVGIPRSISAEVLVAPFNNVDLACSLIEKWHRDIAAVIVEPLQRVIPPKAGFLQALREVTARYGIVLIFDEIVTGFRLAWGGAQEYYGVVPDLATYGKTISGGYPLAAICGKTEVMRTSDSRRHDSGDWAWFGGTLNGNPIAATAGLATLRELRKPGVYAALHTTAQKLRDGMADLASQRSVAMQVVGEGPVFQPVFTDAVISDWGGMLTNDAALGHRFGLGLLERGLYVVPNGKFYLSTAHTADDIARTLDIADQALQAAVGQ